MKQMYSNVYQGQFGDIRSLMAKKEFQRAYDLLQKINNKCSEWYYLTGLSAMNIGYYDEGEEYSHAFNQYNQYRNDYNNHSYNYNRRKRNDSNGCCCCCCGDDCCDTLCQLWCADQCCECCGGDLISCC